MYDIMQKKVIIVFVGPLLAEQSDYDVLDGRNMKSKKKIILFFVGDLQVWRLSEL